MTDLSIFENTNYRNKNITYLRNVKISEWDIKSAGLSVIKYFKLLPDDEIRIMETLDKHSRSVREGKLQRENKQLAEKILTGLSNVRKTFGVINNINPEAVLSIKRDALFLINTNIVENNIKNAFTFVEKNKYTSYVYMSDREFYLRHDGFVDVKGISDECKQLQKHYFLKDIANILRSAERVNPEDLLVLLKSYRSKYLNRQLPIETYRNLLTGRFRCGKYDLDAVDPSMINDIDITQNYINFILPLIRILL